MGGLIVLKSLFSMQFLAHGAYAVFNQSHTVGNKQKIYCFNLLFLYGNCKLSVKILPRPPQVAHANCKLSSLVSNSAATDKDHYLLPSIWKNFCIYVGTSMLFIKNIYSSCYQLSTSYVFRNCLPFEKTMGFSCSSQWCDTTMGLPHVYFA